MEFKWKLIENGDKLLRNNRNPEENKRNCKTLPYAKLKERAFSLQIQRKINKPRNSKKSIKAV